MRRIRQYRSGRPLADRGLAKHFTVLELLASQVDFDPRREAVPHVRHDPVTVEEHVGRHELTADEVMHYERGHVAVPASRIVRRPAVVWIDGVRTPALPDRLLELNERVHAADDSPCLAEAHGCQAAARSAFNQGLAALRPASQPLVFSIVASFSSLPPSIAFRPVNGS